MRITTLLLALPFVSAALTWPAVFGSRPHDEDVRTMSADPPSGAPLLADVIGLKQCTIMSDYTLNLRDVALRLADADRRTLVLAPLNSAIMALPQKPWVDAPEGGNARDGDVGPLRNEDRAAKNIEAFVKRHVVAHFPLEIGVETENMAGQTVRYDVKDGKKYINGQHEVVAEKEAANGAIWVISGVIGSGEGAKDGRAHDGL